MTFAKRTTILAGMVLLAASFTLPTAASAKSGSFGKFNTKSFKQLRTDVEERFEDSETNTEDRPKIKIDRARIRRLLDRYLSKD